MLIVERKTELSLFQIDFELLKPIEIPSLSSVKKDKYFQSNKDFMDQLGSKCLRLLHDHFRLFLFSKYS